MWGIIAAKNEFLTQTIFLLFLVPLWLCVMQGLDFGLERNIKGSRIYAVLKGAIDAGLSIPHSPDILPSDERLSGKHIIDYAQKLKKEDVKRYKKQLKL